MKRTYLWLFVAALLVNVSCNEDILDIKNESQYSDATYFKTAPQFNEAVIAVYAVFLHKGLYSRDHYFIYDLLGNDAERDAPLLGDLLQLTDYSYGTSHQQITDAWQSLFRMVLRANLVLSKAGEWEPTQQADLDLKMQYMAEAKFLRATAYFILVNGWGRVPLKTDYEQRNEYFAARASVEDIWASIEKDLTEAADVLPVQYAAEDLGRATRGAALALLGKSYLYQGKYAQAATELTKLTQAPFSYALNPSFANQFSSTNGLSAETVFNIPYLWPGWGSGNAFYMFGGVEAWGGSTTNTGRAMEYGWNDWRNTIVSNALVQSFRYNDAQGNPYVDPRAALTFYGDAASGGDTTFCHGCPAVPSDTTRGYRGFVDADGEVYYNYPFNAINGYRWRKYENYEIREKEENPGSEINSQVIRYADVLLMLAEAQIEQNQMAAALPLINRVRARVGAFEYTDLGDQTQARQILRRERQLELAGEQSRWFDLKRWNLALEVLNNEKEPVKGRRPLTAKYLLLPIPQLEKDTNPTIAADVEDEWN